MRRTTREDAVAVAFLVLLTTLFWGRFLGSGLVFYARDLGFFFAPLRGAFAQALREGAAPLWNPTLGNGIPMAADPNSAAFFAPTLLFLLRPLSLAVRLSFRLWIFAFPLAGYAGLRMFRLSPFASAIGSAAISVSGPAMSLPTFPNVPWYFVVFLPLCALAWRGRSGPLHSTIAAGILFGVSILIGEPSVALEMMAAVVVFSLADSFSWSIRRVLLIAGIGALVAAPQIVAAVQLLPQTVRASGLPAQFAATYFSVRPARLFAFLWPGLFGDVNSASLHGFWGKNFFDAGAPYVSTLAIGVVTIALLPAAARDPRGRRFLFFSGAALLLAFGRYFPGGSLLREIPGFSFLRYPEKWLTPASFCLIAAAAFGLARIVAGDAAARNRTAAACGTIFAFSAAAAFFVRLLPDASWEILVRSQIAVPEFHDASGEILRKIAGDMTESALIALLAWIVLRAPGVKLRRLAPAMLALLILIDLLPKTLNWVLLAPRGVFDRMPAAAANVTARGERLYYAEETELAQDPLRPMMPAIWGVRYAGNNDIDRFSPRRSFYYGLDLSRLSFSDPRKLRLLRLAGVGSVSTIDPSANQPGLTPLFATSQARTVYALPGAARFRTVFETIPVGNEEAARNFLLSPAFEPDRVAVVESEGAPLSARGTASIEMNERRSDAESVTVKSSAPLLLVRAETFERHWKAWIDGREVKVIPSDFAFQGVFVPAGRHRIDFRYRDRATAAAMMLSLATLLACGAALRRGKR